MNLFVILPRMLLDSKCRTCFYDISINDWYLLNPKDNDYQNSLNLATKLKHCIPEIELNETKVEKMCATCCDLLQKSYEFRLTCLETNKKFISLENLHTDVDFVKCEVEDVQEDIVFEENEEVIKGDISVGFEITKAKDVHNTVSVSITTTGADIKTINQTHLFQNCFSAEENFKRVLLTDSVVKQVVDKITDNIPREIYTDSITCESKLSDSETKTDIKLNDKIDETLHCNTSVNDDCVNYDINVQSLKSDVPHIQKDKRKTNLQKQLKKKKFVHTKKIKNEVIDKSLNQQEIKNGAVKHEQRTKNKTNIKNPISNSKCVKTMFDHVSNVNQRLSRRCTSKSMNKQETQNVETVTKGKQKLGLPSKPKVKMEVQPTNMKCTLCKIQFSSMNIYNIHMKFIHKNHFVESVPKPTTNKKETVKKLQNRQIRKEKNKKHRLKCCICQKQLETEELYNLHKNEHATLEQWEIFKCSICGLIYLSKGGLKRHMKIHIAQSKSVRRYGATPTVKKHRQQIPRTRSQTNKNTRDDNFLDVKKADLMKQTKETRSKSRYKKSCQGLFDTHSDNESITFGTTSISNVANNKITNDNFLHEKIEFVEIPQSEEIKPNTTEHKSEIKYKDDVPDETTAHNFDNWHSGSCNKILEPVTRKRSNSEQTEPCETQTKKIKKDFSETINSENHLLEVESSMQENPTTNSSDLQHFCEDCQLGFDTDVCLKAHICLGTCVELDQLYRCPVCESLFVGREAFIAHLKVAHTNDSNS